MSSRPAFKALGSAMTEMGACLMLRIGAILPTAVLLLALPHAALAFGNPVGVWTITADGTARQCRMQLREDVAEANGHPVAMPPACHHAFPILATVRNWAAVDDLHLTLNDDNGNAILVFEDEGGENFKAAGPDGSSYTLSPIGTAKPRPPIAATTAAAEPESRPKVTTGSGQALSITAVAGHYAVMRGPRDTGCMVTLDDQTKGPQATLKARLAPACRDQGIVIFDPVGWQLKAGHLVLTARKGHTTDLDRNEEGMWVKDATMGASLGLKRL
ncbi:AprI/Inh family metalloprotease inhibitor [Lichenifustis flavocetrariae]|uniref:Protease inhibitor Inh/omp19 family protein n=1 Tax=Lichenifustis flavocetrariae TaxID=2949735 RepID=A0AA42CLM4_9HYPH|nr:AprI/Inh family metalloprotease inhibitor [Lichenifustis flavocetrariae]MCW6507532.1 protease inhibitor Inh/omp19 family protein [Lichenifustis flavocetrariae]